MRFKNPQKTQIYIFLNIRCNLSQDNIQKHKLFKTQTECFREEKKRKKRQKSKCDKNETTKFFRKL